MASLSIRLDPQSLKNPDADLRYVLPDTLQEQSKGRIKADGYDYETGDVMVVFLQVDDPEWAMKFVRAFLAAHEVMGNDLSGLARISAE